MYVGTCTRTIVDKHTSSNFYSIPQGTPQEAELKRPDAFAGEREQSRPRLDVPATSHRSAVTVVGQPMDDMTSFPGRASSSPQPDEQPLHYHPTQCTQEGDQHEYAYPGPTDRRLFPTETALVGPLLRPSYRATVERKCADLYRDNPQALGLAVLMCCSTIDRDGRRAHEPGMRPGRDMMQKVFERMGYAVLCLDDDLEREQVLDAIGAIASISIPSLYKRFFFYACAHGLEDSIRAFDHDVKLKEIIEPLSISEQLHALPLVFLFDSCRTKSSSEDTADLLRHNSVLVRATFRHCPALVDDGCGIFTYALAQGLSTVNDTLLNVLNKHVPDTMQRTIRDHRDWLRLPNGFDELLPVVTYSKIDDIRLPQEMEQLTTPKQQLQHNSATSLKIQVTQPEHQIHRELLLEYKEESEDPERFQRVTIPEGGVVDISSLEPCTRYAVRLIVVRCDGSTSPTEVMWETLPKESPCERRWKKCGKLLLIMLILALLLDGGFLAVGSWTYRHTKKDKDMRFGFGGDVIFGGELNPLWQAEAHITECLQVGDKSHPTSAYFVPRSTLKSLPSEDIRYTANGQVNDSVSITLPGNDEYLMWNSEISLDICLNRPSTSVSSAHYVISRSDDREHKPVCKGNIPVGDSSERNCPRGSIIECPILDPGYYTIQLNLAAGTTYNASVHLMRTYVTDIGRYRKCEDVTNNPCKVHHDLKDTEYVILFNITTFPPYFVVPQTTHLCVSYGRSLFYLFFFVPSLIIFVLCVLLILILYKYSPFFRRCLCCHCVKKFRRHGYQRPPLNYNY